MRIEAIHLKLSVTVGANGSGKTTFFNDPQIATYMANGDKMGYLWKEVFYRR